MPIKTSHVKDCLKFGFGPWVTFEHNEKQVVIPECEYIPGTYGHTNGEAVTREHGWCHRWWEPSQEEYLTDWSSVHPTKQKCFDAAFATYDATYDFEDDAEFNRGLDQWELYADENRLSSKVIDVTRSV